MSLLDEIRAEFESMDASGTAALERIEQVDIDVADDAMLTILAADVKTIIAERKQIAKLVKAAIQIAKKLPELLA